MRSFRYGEWLVTCERCGDVYYASEIKKEWTGFAVCADCWEPRHEVEQVPHLRVVHSIPFTRPRAAVAYVDSDGIGTWAIGSTFVIPPTRTVESLTASTDYDGTFVVRARCPNHRFHSGDTIDILGATDSNYNGAFTITVIDDDSFRYPVTTLPAADENPAFGVTADGIKKGINEATYNLWKATEYAAQVYLP